uniref:ATP synthase F0 subunit 8 n=1 Tax=Eochroa trimenii TaxID=2909400 RepID=UPI001F143C0F|nr:ATP synthase F0 subunit 8 [Eochroa trimenii]ULO26039.1 ATP synthase F0 subunit 8 [Eochroa trimenii]
MPQMMPINWMFSFIFFISIFLIFNIMNYYIFNFNMKLNKNLKDKKMIKDSYWKW